jgi:hypothetical protein
MSYLYAATSQPPTAVNFSLVCHFTAATDQNLVIVRSNLLEVHTFLDGHNPDGFVGLKPVLTVPLFGLVKGIEVLHPAGSDTDHLFVLIGRKKFSILAFDPNTRKIVTKIICNVKERVGRDFEFGQRSFADPDGRMIGMILYDGQLTVLFGFSLSLSLTLSQYVRPDCIFDGFCMICSFCHLTHTERRTHSRPDLRKRR